jgi:hypothetical protein
LVFSDERKKKRKEKKRKEKKRKKNPFQMNFHTPILFFLEIDEINAYLIK